jgi:hypothetical protein
VISGLQQDIGIGLTRECTASQLMRTLYLAGGQRCARSAPADPSRVAGRLGESARRVPGCGSRCRQSHHSHPRGVAGRALAECRVRHPEPAHSVRDARLPRLGAPAELVTPPALDPAGTVLVTGDSGLRAVQVARHFVLLSWRADAAPSTATLVADLAARDTTASVAVCDVADPRALLAVLEEVSAWRSADRRLAHRRRARRRRAEHPRPRPGPDRLPPQGGRRVAPLRADPRPVDSGVRALFLFGGHARWRRPWQSRGPRRSSTQSRCTAAPPDCPGRHWLGGCGRTATTQTSCAPGHNRPPPDRLGRPVPGSLRGGPAGVRHLDWPARSDSAADAARRRRAALGRHGPVAVAWTGQAGGRTEARPAAASMLLHTYWPSTATGPAGSSHTCSATSCVRRQGGTS